MRGDIMITLKRLGFGDLFTQDSRGIPLNVGDMVLCLSNENYCEYFFGKIDTYKNSYDIDRNRLYKSRSLDNYYNDYVIKIDKKKMLPINEYLEKLGIPDEYNSYMDVLGQNVYRKIEQNYRESHNDTLRGIHAIEILGQDLKPGDFVLYRDTECNKKAHSHIFSYGILISDSKVFTYKKTVKRVFYVVKLTDLTEEELNFYNYLSTSFQQMYLSKSKNEYKCGDVFISGKNSYVYLGKVDFIVNILEPSNVLCNLNFDKDKNYWFRINSDIPNNEAEFKLFLQQNLLYNSTINRKRQYLNETFYYEYTSVDEFKPFLTELPKNSVYYSHLDLGDEVEFIIPKLEFYTFKFLIKFKK